MTTPETRRSACPSCGGSVRPDAAFCGQCYADFRPAPPVAPPPTAPAAGATYGVAAPDPLTAPLLDVVLPAGSVPVQGAVPPAVPAAPAPAAAVPLSPSGAPAGWPCSRCDAVNDFTATTCATCGSSFLSVVSEANRVNVSLPLVGDLSRFSRGQRALIALGAILALLAPLALLTLLLTGSPPAEGTVTNQDGSVTTTTTTESGG